MIARGFKPISRALTALTVLAVSQGSCFRHVSDRTKQTATGQAEQPNGARKRLLAAQAARPGPSSQPCATASRPLSQAARLP
jgi:hypothetical protein